MTDRRKDIVLSLILFVIAAVWTWTVHSTIPPGFGGGDIGPRVFPLTFGLLLMGLSALLFLKSLSAGSENSGEFAPSGEEIPATRRVHWGAALLLLGEIVLYGVLLEKIGFVLATPIIALLVMAINLRIRSWKALVAMPLGLTIGSWLVFEKLMGIYLATGTWINLG